jgi:hypothetical protein
MSVLYHLGRFLCRSRVPRLLASDSGLIFLRVPPFESGLDLTTYIKEWVDRTQPFSETLNVYLLHEKDGARTAVFPALCESVKAHLIGAEVLERLRFSQAAAAIRGRIPTRKRIRSGDLAEVIATDYLNQWGPFVVPLKRLRYKDDRDMSMRGDDMIGLDSSETPVRVLKAEVKSRQTLYESVVGEAVTALDANQGRPKPSSLSFTSMRLRDENKDELAQVFERLQESDVEPKRITHLVFTFTGNDPSSALRVYAVAGGAVGDRRLVGMVVSDHQDFIERVFEVSNA